MGLKDTIRQFGFVNVGVLAIVLLTAAVASGATYGFVTYQQLMSENERLADQVMDGQYASVSNIDTISDHATNTATSSETDELVDSEVTDNETDTTTSSQNAQSNETPTAVTQRPPRTSAPNLPLTPQPSTDTDDSLNQTSTEEVVDRGEDATTNLTKIENVQIEAGTTSAKVTWQTTKPADSMLMLQGREHLSENKLDTKHKVVLTNLKPETAYNYEIIAWREGVTLYSGRREVIASWRDPEVVIVDNFTTQEEERVFVTRYIDLEVNDDGECTVIEIADTKGEPLVNARVELDGVYEDTENDYRYAANAITRTTNQNGIVRYCRPVTELKITDLATGEVYQEETPTYGHSIYSY